jgi:Zn-dependent peptidase ImmA (M78 family)
MAGSINFRLSSSVLEWARISMGYTLEEAAKKANVPTEKYEAWELGNSLPTYKQLETLAENVYKRPIAILLLKDPPEEAPIQKDFRTVSNIELRNMGPELRLAVRKAKRYQLILEEIEELENKSKVLDFQTTVNENPVEVAKQFREFIGLTVQEQKSWKPDESSRMFRRVLESVGVYIFHMAFPMNQGRAFCLTGNFPIVVLNMNDSNKGGIFSLFHEIGHILLNENDIFKDNISERSNQDYYAIETFCNKFSASLLVPDDAFEKDISFLRENRDHVQNVISRLSRQYNVSHEVIARKLVIRELLSNETFWTMKRLWDAQAQASKEKDRKKNRDNNDSGFDQSIKVLFEKGPLYTSKILSAYQSGRISSSDLLSFLETKSSHIPKIVERLTR